MCTVLSEDYVRDSKMQGLGVVQGHYSFRRSGGIRVALITAITCGLLSQVFDTAGWQMEEGDKCACVNRFNIRSVYEAYTFVNLGDSRVCKLWQLPLRTPSGSQGQKGEHDWGTHDCDHFTAPASPFHPGCVLTEASPE